MAQTHFGTNDAETVKIWSKLLMRDALHPTLFNKFLGTGKRSIIQRLTDLEKNSGDQIKYDLLMQATGSGATGNTRLKGAEEAMVYHQDSVVIDQLRNAHSFTTMAQQRSLHELRTDAQENLSDWFAGKLDTYMFRALCGDTTLTHGQTNTAPDGDHYIMCGDVAQGTVLATQETSLGTNDEISLADLDFAKEKAETISPKIRKVSIDGGEYYVVVLHTYSAVDIRLSTGAATTVTWPNIQQYANVRGLKNPIFTNSMGVYNGMILFESDRIVEFDGAAVDTVRRNLLLGAQAGTFALGNAYKNLQRKQYGGENLFSWFEETDDFGNETGIAAGSVFGMKKCVFNSKDFGTMVMSAYSALHN